MNTLNIDYHLDVSLASAYCCLLHQSAVHVLNHIDSCHFILIISCWLIYLFHG